jgi:hypothetical protein
MGIFDSILPIRQLLPTQFSTRINLGSLLGFAPDPNDSQFNIDEFRSSLSAHGEISKQDKFNVVFTVPSAVQYASGTSPRELTLLCENAELPGRDISLIEYRHYGFIKRLPHNNQYGQAQFTFISTGDFWEKRLFDRWLDVMIPTESGLITYPLDNQGNQNYETSVLVNQYSQTGDLIYTVKLIDAMPTSVTPMSLDWSSDAPHKLSVTFNFRKWISDSTNASVPPTDFGQAVGGQVSVSPIATNPINNQTNNVPNNPLVNGIFNAGITTGERLLSQSFRLRL